MEHQHTNSPRLIRIKQVQALTGLSRSYIYSLAHHPSANFPRSIPLIPGGSSRAWQESAVLDWINQRVEAGKLEVTNA
ncbi:AlpA family phage regulatory protein [Haliea sp. E1-2-M8]|uniref:helix-turn-helix transcriptional regulator n=1 Tax=Haliea sp. E1-2-M8 TaxID=3064706 RepID=UPI002719D6FF|nr:AlpA family phage regulatory protein [Haliea sp. E1-2-M8]MDO8860999.1 AlpA family phage regulatory protein [Haliea sp. E1-2-M8]